MRRLVLMFLLLSGPALAADWTPQPRGRWTMPGERGAAVVLHVSEELALVAADDTDDHNVPGGWFWTIDLSDPDDPVQLDELELTGVPTDIARHGDVAAVTWYHESTNRGAVELIDLTDPADVTSLAEVVVYGAPEELVWTPPYVVVGIRGTGAGIGDHFLLEDVSDPANPVFMRTNLLPYATATLALDGTLLYSAGDDGSLRYLEWFDAEDPLALDLVDSYGTTLKVLDLEPRGDRIHTLISGALYMLVDMSEDFIWLRSSVALPVSGSALAVRDDIVYVAGGDLTVIDVSDPDNPAIAGSYASGTAVDIALTDDYAVMLDAGGLWTLDLYDPPTPVTVADFRARQVGGVVGLSWRAPALSAERFRLAGSFSGLSWPVAVSEAGEGAFTARDEQAPVGGVSYVLSIDGDEGWTEIARTAVLVEASVLAEPFPNPFNPRVTVPYALTRPGPVRLSVYDAMGRRLAVLVDESKPAGAYRAVWDGTDDRGRALPSGSYRIRLETEGITATRSATLLR